MKRLAMDIETDSLDATRIHVICTQDIQTGERRQYLNTSHIPEEKERFLGDIRPYDCFVLHNGIGFDIPTMNRLLGEGSIDIKKTLDTLVLSRLFDFTMDNKGHSLKAWGQRLGDFKLDFKEFDVLTQEMIDYCHQDVEVTVKLFKRFEKQVTDPDWAVAIQCEHDIQILCEEMTANGFYFDHQKADHLLDEVELRMAELEEGFQKDFPPKLEELNRLKYRKKKDGSLMSNVVKAQEKYFKTTVDYSVDPPELVCYDWVEFNPASPKMRIDRLWEAGWTPVDKTKGHYEYDRDQQRKNRRRAWR